VLGGRNGTLASGLVGGLVSSTATTITLSRRSQQDNSPALAAAAIMAASGVVFLRVAAIVGVLNASLLPRLIGPMVGMFLVGIIVAAVYTARQARTEIPLPEVKNPCELRFSLVFALLYTVVLFLLAAGRYHLGDRGVYAVSALSGLTNMDAIAISIARFSNLGKMDLQMAVRAIIVAAMASIVFKTVLVAVLGSRSLLKRMALGFALLFLAGFAALLLVPAAG